MVQRFWLGCGNLEQETATLIDVYDALTTASSPQELASVMAGAGGGVETVASSLVMRLLESEAVLASLNEEGGEEGGEGKKNNLNNDNSNDIDDDDVQLFRGRVSESRNFLPRRVTATENQSANNSPRGDDGDNDLDEESRQEQERERQRAEDTEEARRERKEFLERRHQILLSIPYELLRRQIPDLVGMFAAAGGTRFYRFLVRELRQADTLRARASAGIIGYAIQEIVQVGEYLVDKFEYLLDIIIGRMDDEECRINFCLLLSRFQRFVPGVVNMVVSNEHRKKALTAHLLAMLKDPVSQSASSGCLRALADTDKMFPLEMTATNRPLLTALAASIKGENVRGEMIWTISSFIRRGLSSSVNKWYQSAPSKKIFDGCLIDFLRMKIDNNNKDEDENTKNVVVTASYVIGELARKSVSFRRKLIHIVREDTEAETIRIATTPRPLGISLPRKRGKRKISGSEKKNRENGKNSDDNDDDEENGEIGNVLRRSVSQRDDHSNNNNKDSDNNSSHSSSSSENDDNGSSEEEEVEETNGRRRGRLLRRSNSAPTPKVSRKRQEKEAKITEITTTRKHLVNCLVEVTCIGGGSFGGAMALGLAAKDDCSILDRLATLSETEMSSLILTLVNLMTWEQSPSDERAGPVLALSMIISYFREGDKKKKKKNSGKKTDESTIWPCERKSDSIACCFDVKNILEHVISQLFIEGALVAADSEKVNGGGGGGAAAAAAASATAPSIVGTIGEKRTSNGIEKGAQKKIDSNSSSTSSATNLQSDNGGEEEEEGKLCEQHQLQSQQMWSGSKDCTRMFIRSLIRLLSAVVSAATEADTDLIAARAEKEKGKGEEKGEGKGEGLTELEGVGNEAEKSEVVSSKAGTKSRRIVLDSEEESSAERANGRVSRNTEEESGGAELFPDKNGEKSPMEGTNDHISEQEAGRNGLLSSKMEESRMEGTNSGEQSQTEAANGHLSSKTESPMEWTNDNNDQSATAAAAAAAAAATDEPVFAAQEKAPQKPSAKKRRRFSGDADAAAAADLMQHLELQMLEEERDMREEEEEWVWELAHLLLCTLGPEFERLFFEILLVEWEFEMIKLTFEVAFWRNLPRTNWLAVQLFLKFWDFFKTIRSTRRKQQEQHKQQGYSDRQESDACHIAKLRETLEGAGLRSEQRRQWSREILAKMDEKVVEEEKEEKEGSGVVVDGKKRRAAAAGGGGEKLETKKRTTEESKSAMKAAVGFMRKQSGKLIIYNN